jgi:hypothetical protein
LPGWLARIGDLGWSGKEVKRAGRLLVVGWLAGSVGGVVGGELAWECSVVDRSMGLIAVSDAGDCGWMVDGWSLVGWFGVLWTEREGTLLVGLDLDFRTLALPRLAGPLLILFLLF